MYSSGAIQAPSVREAPDHVSRRFGRRRVERHEPHRCGGRRVHERRALGRIGRREGAGLVVQLSQPRDIDAPERAVVPDRLRRVVVHVVPAVDHVRAFAVHVQRPIGADLDERRMGAAGRRDARRQREAREPVDRLGDARQELPVPGQPVEPDQELDVPRRRVRDERARLVGARAGRLEVRRVLQRPARLRRSLLHHDERLHPAQDRIHEACLAQGLVALEEKLDVLRGHVVVERDVRRVVRHEVGLRRVPLGPAADRILAVEHELNGFVEGRLVFRIALFKIDTQQQPGRVHRHDVVERGVVPVVLKLLEAPRVFSDARVPVAERPIPREVRHVVPATGRMLTPDQDAGRLLGGEVVVLVACRVVRIEEQVGHRGGARRLDPDDRRTRFDLAPPPRQIGQVRPDVSAVRADPSRP